MTQTTAQQYILNNVALLRISAIAAKASIPASTFRAWLYGPGSLSSQQWQELKIVLYELRR